MSEAAARLLAGRVHGVVSRRGGRCVGRPIARGALGIVYGFLAARGRPVAACIAAGTLASANHFTWLARTGRIDMPLTFTVTLAVLKLAPDFRAGRDSRPWPTWLVGYVAISAGILLKG